MTALRTTSVRTACYRVLSYAMRSFAETPIEDPPVVTQTHDVLHDDTAPSFPLASAEEFGDDTEEAIRRLEVQLAKHLDWDADPEYQLFYAGDALMEHYEYSNEIVDIRGALMAYRRAHQLTPDDNPEKPPQLMGLAYEFTSYFKRSGSIGLLQDIVSLTRDAKDLLPSGHPGLPSGLGYLASTLKMLYHRLQNFADLEEAINICRQCIELTDGKDSELPQRLGLLGGLLYHRFLRLDELDDLEKALDAQHCSLELMPDDDPELALRQSNLGVFLWARFQRLGESIDLDRALEADRRSVAFTPEGDPDLAWKLSNLAVSLYSRFTRLGEFEDLEAALEAEERSVTLTPDEHPELPLQLCVLAGCFHRRFEELGEVPDLERTLDILQRAIDLTPNDNVEFPRLLTNLGEALRHRFERLGDITDLQRSIDLGGSAVELTPDGHPYKPLWIRDLALSLRARFVYDSTEKSFNAAVECFIAATNQQLGAPYCRFECVEACVQMLRDHTKFSSSESLLLAHSRIIDTLPELVWLGQSVQRRFEESARVGELVNAAVCAAIEAGDHSRAVEWLEEGRGLVWSQVTSMRTPLDELTEHLPDLARELHDVHQELQMPAPSTNTHRGLTPSDFIAPDERGLGFQVDTSTADRHRQAAIRYEGLLKRIREHHSFQNFMRPMKLRSLVSMPTFLRLNGTLVFINVDRVRCDALALTHMGEVSLVRLSDLSRKRAEELRSLWTQHVGLCRGHRRGSIPQENIRHGTTNLYGHILGRLWSWVVHPILKALGLMEKKAYGANQLPHVVWCPTGPLTQLPLHAAGIYGKGRSGLHTFDYVVSSYTPSLSALLRCYEGKGDIAMNPSILLVALPDAPRKGLSELPYVRDETTNIRTLFPERRHVVLEGEDATVGAVLDVLDQHPWVHLASHGSQNAQDPTESAFELYDGGLTLSSLMGKTSGNAELAFLSACETAVGDPKIPEESAHLAAGMLAVGFKGVVATMWSIWDKDGPVVVGAYYKRLLELRGSGRLKRGETGAAYALHDAVKSLREAVGENEFERWVPFVHFGA